MEVRELAEELFDSFWMEMPAETRGFRVPLRREIQNPDLLLLPAFFNLGTPDGAEPGPISGDLAAKIAAAMKQMMVSEGVSGRIATMRYGGNPRIEVDPLVAALAAQCGCKPLVLEFDLEGRLAIVGEQPAPKTRLLPMENVLLMGRRMRRIASFLKMNDYVVSDVLAIVDWEVAAKRWARDSGPALAVHPLFKVVSDLMCCYRPEHVTAAFADSVVDAVSFLRGVPE